MKPRNTLILKSVSLTSGNGVVKFLTNNEGGGDLIAVVSDSCDPMDSSLPGSSAHGISQAGILQWVAISYSKGSSPPRG